MAAKTTASHWADQPDFNYCVRAAFGDGTEAFTTVEHAADALDFIDRDKGIRDLFMGLTFRSSQGTMFTIVGTPVTADPGSLAGRLLGL